MKSQIRKIGNSKGVVIPPVFLNELKLDKDSDIDIELSGESIIIKPLSDPRKNWDIIFKKAIENDELPEEDLFDGMSNEIDGEEWTW